MITRCDYLGDGVFGLHGELTKDGNSVSWGCMVPAESEATARARFNERLIQHFNTTYLVKTKKKNYKPYLIAMGLIALTALGCVCYHYLPTQICIEVPKWL